jgi:nitric oxide reductase NorE protein
LERPPSADPGPPCSELLAPEGARFHVPLVVTAAPDRRARHGPRPDLEVRAVTDTSTQTSAGQDEQRGSWWLRGHVPGEPGIWVFVLADMCVFAAFFGVFLVARIHESQLFAASRPELTVPFGLVNTIVLLTSSLFVAFAVRRLRAGDRSTATKLVTGAMACGVVFLVIKVVEYSEKVAHGIFPTTNDFFLYYFIFTGIHAVHVILGLVGLTVVRFVVNRPTPGANDQRTAEIGATFWHMVDLLWVVLFPLFYLVA